MGIPLSTSFPRRRETTATTRAPTMIHIARTAFWIPACAGMMRYVALAFLLSTAAFALAALPRESRVPGGVAIISLQEKGEIAPQVFSNGARVWVARDTGNNWNAVVGIVLAAKPGAQTIIVNGRAETFTLRDKKYPVQKLTLNKAMVDPPKEVTVRIERESKHLALVRSTFSEQAETNANFLLPALGRLSSRYGVARVLNGQPRSPHAGLDVAIPTGTPITAPADGIVLDADDYYFCGKTLFIDHGNGLITMHCHLSEFIAAVGERVKQGQRVALSGATGRATGPHLHWSVYLNGVSVEPELFLKTEPKTAEINAKK
jgi:murein DD-endopeptidase MepM/ murein hydrolase activator NlpD